ncbi:MAG: CCA tRNA nucleotidyltransferase [Lachnospiraceae bacterium]|nr:CCA tRNA nucleotidyltransferase [Lachnospiraceae bacterium]
MQTILLPEKVSRILNTLSAAGFEAFAVGGCVRDAILGRVPGDWDITTNALPEQVKALFRRTVDTGIAHGTVTVMLGSDGFEVTTYRLDGDYSDSRHPDKVTFTASLEEDLKRRDFTINAMAYHPEKGMIDLFGGQEDLQRRIIRCVGDPRERFDEDALRIMRALRFSAQLGFRIEEQTRAAIRAFAPRLQLISRERIHDEFLKLLLSPHPDRLLDLAECGITAQVFPLWDTMLETGQNSPFHQYSVGIHTLKVIESVPAEPVLRLAAFLHDCGKPACKSTDLGGRDHFYGHAEKSAEIAEDFLKEYRFDNKTIADVLLLIRVHDDHYHGTRENVRREMNRVGQELFPSYLKLILADNLAKSRYALEEFMPRYERFRKLYEEILQEGDPITLKDLAVKGSDLIAAGMKPGPAMGETLNRMLDDVLGNPKHNNKEYLLTQYVK